MYEGSKDNNDFYCNILCVRVFNEETGLLEYTLLGLVSAGVESVDIYTFIPNNEVIYGSSKSGPRSILTFLLQGKDL